jgi:hypothetical protein
MLVLAANENEEARDHLEDEKGTFYFFLTRAAAFV